MSILQSGHILNPDIGSLPVRLKNWLRNALPEGRPLPVEVWQRRHRMIVALLWVHAFGLFCFGVLQGFSLQHSLLESGVVAVAALIATFGNRSRRFRSAVASIGLITASAVLVHLSGGYVEMHFHFFVMLIVIALYHDWVPYLLAVGYVALHHGVIGMLDPMAVYNHPDAWAQPWKWALIHAGFVVGASVANIVNWHLSEAARARGELILNSAGDGICGLDEAGRIAFLNPAAAAMSGCEADDLIGKPAHVLLDPAAHGIDDQYLHRYSIYRTLSDGLQHSVPEDRFRRTDNTEYWVEYDSTPIRQRGKLVGAVITFRDITERKEYEAQLAHQAFSDTLTQLPNRALFLDRLEHALARSSRHEQSLAVLFIDLDNFKVINDSLGHQLGDQLLVTVAERLKLVIRPEDTVARLGGDEFTVLIEELGDISDAIRVAERVQESIQQPLRLAGHDIVMTASIGITVNTVERDEPTAILQAADVAMYRAKANGKAHFEVFDSDMGLRATERMQLESDFRHGLEFGEFRLYYQPIVDLHSQEILGTEALVRWDHPTRGTITPSEFIPLAEETGLIMPLGRWVLQEACHQTKVWQDEFPGNRPLKISVNLSPRQFRDPRLVQQVTEILTLTGLEPGCLNLEITETATMDDTESAIQVLQQLRDLGVTIAIDDFGTGYSSLAYLKRFPIDTLKVDKMFVDGLRQDTGSGAIIRSVLMFAQSMNLTVTGEGIETAEQLEELQAMGCQQGQGYYFAKPLTIDAMEAILTRDLAQHQRRSLALMPSTVTPHSKHGDLPS